MQPQTNNDYRRGTGLSHRRSGGFVPATGSSSTIKGPSGELPTSSSEESVIVEERGVVQAGYEESDLISEDSWDGCRCPSKAGLGYVLTSIRQCKPGKLALGGLYMDTGDHRYFGRKGTIPGLDVLSEPTFYLRMVRPGYFRRVYLSEIEDLDDYAYEDHFNPGLHEWVEPRLLYTVPEYVPSPEVVRGLGDREGAVGAFRSPALSVLESERNVDVERVSISSSEDRDGGSSVASGVRAESLAGFNTKQRAIIVRRVGSVRGGPLARVVANAESLLREVVDPCKEALRGMKAERVEAYAYLLRRAMATLSARARAVQPLKEEVVSLRAEMDALRRENASMAERVRALEGRASAVVSPLAAPASPAIGEGVDVSPVSTVLMDTGPGAASSPRDGARPRDAPAGALEAVLSAIADLGRRMEKLEDGLALPPPVGPVRGGAGGGEGAASSIAGGRRGSSRGGVSIRPALTGESEGSRPAVPVESRAYAMAVATGKVKPPQVDSRRAPAVERKSLPVGAGPRADNIRRLRRRLPRGSAVMVEHPRGLSFGETLKLVRASISLAELGVPEGSISARGAENGGLLIEVRGEGSEESARVIAGRLREAFEGREGFAVSCPSRRLRLRLSGQLGVLTAEEVRSSLGAVGSCDRGDIRLGPVRTVRGGVGVALADCPARAALRVAGVGEIHVGWIRVRATLLEGGGPPKCFRCLGRGHWRHRCPSVVDRAANCLNCGESGHRVADCRERPACPVCRERGLRAEHRPGSAACPPIPPGPFRPSEVAAFALAPVAAAGPGPSSSSGRKRLAEDSPGSPGVSAVGGLVGRV